MGMLLGVLLISTVLVAANWAMFFAFSLVRGDVPAYGPVRHVLHFHLARRESRDLDRGYQTLTGGP